MEDVQLERPIYLDYNATTPVDPSVVEAMLPYLHECFGNPSSQHPYGYQAHEAMDRARAQVASLIGASPGEIVFTGGGSETDNLAIKGVVFPRLPRPTHVITTAVDHPAVLNTLGYLRTRFGVEVTLVPVDETCLVSPEEVQRAIRPETALISIMHANNEVGTLQPIREIASVAREAGIPFHIDAAQSCGKVPVNVDDLGVDLLTIASHKLYGPKGIGALYVRSGVRLDAVIHGSGQELGLRAGTENVAGMVGFGAACQLVRARLSEEELRLRSLSTRLLESIQARVLGTFLNGHPVCRLPNTVNVSMPGSIGQAVLAYAPQVAASTGSACHSASPEPSSILLAMGLPVERALGAIRLSLGHWTTEEDVDCAVDALATSYAALVPSATPSAR